MRAEGTRKHNPVSARLVRVWFGGVGLTALILAGLLAFDVIRGEGVAHLGLPFFLELSAVALVGVALVLLPLLIAAVVINRRVKG